ncbi:uncharacterized protein LOC142240680 [Haematobia irritans]|uniref:uncharacterized protein LOC142240680 n=1 Tax=Haematobia irritans TaxID=7368 RepID=UPI003F50AC63
MRYICVLVLLALALVTVTARRHYGNSESNADHHHRHFDKYRYHGYHLRHRSPYSYKRGSRYYGRHYETRRGLRDPMATYGSTDELSYDQRKEEKIDSVEADPTKKLSKDISDEERDKHRTYGYDGDHRGLWNRYHHRRHHRHHHRNDNNDDNYDDFYLNKRRYHNNRKDTKDVENSDENDFSHPATDGKEILKENEPKSTIDIE